MSAAGSSQWPSMPRTTSRTPRPSWHSASGIKKEPQTAIELDDGESTQVTAAATPSERRFDEPPLFLQINDRRMNGVQNGVPNGVQQAPSQSEAFQFMNGSFGGIAKKLQYLNDTLGDLHSLGIQHDVQLPELVLVGDQSAGKSSLMSGLAGINLPRSGGICTRCVTHIRVSRHQTWSCRVSLRRKYGYYPPESGIIEVPSLTDGDKFPPWKEENEKVLDFKTLDHPNEIEDVLRWAQIAVLNPSKSHEHYIPGSGHATVGENAFERATESTEALFSPNVISLEIKHPEFPDLSFYDLPGVFVRPGNPQENYLVNVVKNLAKMYISHREAIIIWAVPMNVDPMNSTMSKIIEDSHALDRTIGVMTKADLLPMDEGARRQWREILGRQTHKTGHGYYVTSRRPDHGLEEQNRWEDSFFDNPAKWPADFVEFRDRCGLKQLHLDLSDKLGEAFGNCLPTIKTKVGAKLYNAKRQLASLPEIPSNVELEVKTSLRNFVDLVVTRLHGGEFSSTYQRLGEQFRDCLAGMKPKVIVTDSTDVIEIIDDDDDDDRTPVGTPKRRAPEMAPPATPSKRARTSHSQVKREDMTGRSGSVPPPGQRVRGTPVPDIGPFSKFSPPPSRKLRDIKETIARHNRAGQPGLVAAEVHEELCRQAVSPWQGPIMEFQQAVMKEVRAIIDAALNEAFSKLQRRLIYKRARAALHAMLNYQAEETQRFLLKMLKIHTRQLFTLNDNELGRFRAMEEEILRRHRHMMRWQAYTGESGPIKPLEQLSDQEKEAENKRRAAQVEKMGKDPFQAEVDVFAYVRGYYRLASSRMTDTVALILHQDMIPEVEAKLTREAYLEIQLELLPEKPDIYEVLMSEDEATARKRVDLRADVEKFVRALESIAQLEARSRADVAENGYESDHLDSAI
ncbi:related to Mx protein [Cephalotrichum gorgonifer]|uniref:Related to Mx protein n=1 Tax=Cephalotrichum gorgonifer TaxID=2041049 RepID=A0AAE8N4P8_9PEZI|nr:related to Mx protein [Cephalotrichum gorgonifer]